MGQTRIEPWKRWYSKARAAYLSITDESSEDEIIDAYKDIGPIPLRNHSPEEEIARFDKRTQPPVNCYMEAVRLFKKEFGDSEDCFVLAREHGPPMFFMGMQESLDLPMTGVCVSTLVRSDFGSKSKYTRTMTFVEFDRRSLMKRTLSGLAPFFEGFTNTMRSIFFIVLLSPLFLMTSPVMVPYCLYLFFNFACERDDGWGWRESYSASRSDFLQVATANGKDFMESANETAHDIFASALSGDSVRGAKVSVSQQAGQGLPPNMS